MNEQYSADIYSLPLGLARVGRPLDAAGGGQYTPSEPPTSGGGGGNGMEARVARLESDVSHIQSDVSEIKTDIRELRTDNKLLLGMIIASAIGLAGIMAKGFNWF